MHVIEYSVNNMLISYKKNYGNNVCLCDSLIIYVFKVDWNNNINNIIGFFFSEQLAKRLLIFASIGSANWLIIALDSKVSSSSMLSVVARALVLDPSSLSVSLLTTARSPSWVSPCTPLPKFPLLLWNHTTVCSQPTLS